MRWGRICTLMGELASARSHLEQGIALYDPQQRLARVPMRFLYSMTVISCQSYAAFVLCLLGYPDQALKRIHAARPLAQEMAHPAGFD